MGTAIGELLPLAVAIAISVTMIITTVLAEGAFRVAGGRLECDGDALVDRWRCRVTAK